jgi:Flp pilus assembly pilin Flp
VIRSPRRRSGQSLVEYLLGISVLAIGLAAGFTAFGEGVRDVFHNVRTTVQMPYP